MTPRLLYSVDGCEWWQCAIAARSTLFWSHVERGDGCWEWCGHIARNGYGLYTVRGADGTRRTVGTHRAAYVLANGYIPKGMSVLHSCDNRRCCNPQHLRVGTALDNMADAIARGRRASTAGERHGNRRLTEQQAREVLRLRAVGGRLSSYARSIGMSQSTVRSVGVSTWLHLAVNP